MKSKQLRELSGKDLETKMHDLYQELLKLRSQVATGAAPKTAGQIRRSKRTIAQIQTILGERRSAKQ